MLPHEYSAPFIYKTQWQQTSKIIATVSLTHAYNNRRWRKAI